MVYLYCVGYIREVEYDIIVLDRGGDSRRIIKQKEVKSKKDENFLIWLEFGK